MHRRFTAAWCQVQWDVLQKYYFLSKIVVCYSFLPASSFYLCSINTGQKILCLVRKPGLMQLAASQMYTVCISVRWMFLFLMYVYSTATQICQVCLFKYIEKIRHWRIYRKIRQFWSRKSLRRGREILNVFSPLIVRIVRFLNCDRSFNAVFSFMYHEILLRVWLKKLCLCRPFCIFERCLDSNVESFLSKQARYQLSSK